MNRSPTPTLLVLPCLTAMVLSTGCGDQTVAEQTPPASNTTTTTAPASAPATSTPSPATEPDTTPVSKAPVITKVPPLHLPIVKLPPQHFQPASRKADLQLLDYTYFTIGYDNARKNPAWVVYNLDGPVTHPGAEAKRPSSFATDKRTSAKVSQSDYVNSGYDRGHMCPSYAMFSRFGEQGEDATFVCTNIIPQPHALNAGWWEHLEERIAGRDGHSHGWAETVRHVTVINGPVYRDRPTYLPAGIEVPDACFSIIFDYIEETGRYRALAFEIPDVATASGTLEQYLVPISKIEVDTQLDIFAGVDPAVKAETETMKPTKLW